MSVRLRVNEGLLVVLIGVCSVHFAGCAGIPGAMPEKSSPASGVSVPAMPSNIAATASDAQVTLTWNPSTGATSYHVRRAANSSGPYVQVAAPSATGYVDAPLTNGTTYFYTVSAVGSAGESPNSTQVSAKPAGQAPALIPTISSVTISPTNASSITSGTLTFAATVQGTTNNTTVRWTALLGTITSSGQYTAPSSAGSDKVTATSNADPSKSASTSVKVTAAAPPPPPTSNPAPSPPPPASDTSARLAPEFFGMTWNDVHRSHVPTVDFGSIRLWDTKTKWADLEPSAGNYNWGTLDSWLATAAANDKDVLYTFGEVPTWASMRPTEACLQDTAVHGCAAPSKDVDAGDNLWKTFVAALVHHSLASRTGHIKYYEIWNEANEVHGVFWSGTNAQLATMAKDAFEIIHSLDPNALVLGPSPTGGTFSSNWMKQYWAAGGGTAMDIIADHGWTKPVNGLQNPQDLLAVVDSVRAAETSYGLPEKPIWFTEGNWGKNGGTNDQQVAFLATEYIFLWSKGVSRSYWYAWDSTSNWGPLWDPARGVYPAGTAYGLLYKWMVGSTHAPDPCTEDAESTWTCKLTLADGSAAEILWNPVAAKSVSVEGTFHSYRTLDDSTVHSISGDGVAIGKKPILAVD